MWFVWKCTLRADARPVTTETTDFLVTVCGILTQQQWEAVGNMLNRSVAYCQERYYALMQAKLTRTDPAQPSYLLVTQKQYEASLRSGRKATVSNTNSVSPSKATTATSNGSAAAASNPTRRSKPHVAVDGTVVPQATRQLLSNLLRRIVDTAVARAERQTVIESHKVYNHNITHPSAAVNHVQQPKLVGMGLLYVYNMQLLPSNAYPWAGKHVPSEALFVDLPFNFADHSLVYAKWNTTVVQCAALLTHFCEDQGAAGGDVLLKCKQTFYSNAMPTNYMFMEARNRSEVSHD